MPAKLFVGNLSFQATEEDLRELFQQLERARVDVAAMRGAPRMKDARWCEPTLVGQVAFTEWTADGLLRQPSFQGLRPDKRPEECLVEAY